VEETRHSTSDGEFFK